VSGGPDSLALLLLANAARPEMVEAASVDHGLREDSADECQAVAAICAERDIPHNILRVEVPPGNLQDGARAARYAALQGWMQQRGLNLLATAHHADDQAETMLMRLNRASGLSGLTAIRAQRALVQDTVASSARSLQVIRPLLGWRKAELEMIVSQAGIEAAADPSNSDIQFDRARLRKALAQADWIDPLSIAQSADHLSDALEALEWAAEQEWSAQVHVTQAAIDYSPTAPKAVQLLVLERAFQRLGCASRGSALARLRDKLATGEGGNVGGVLVTVEGESWRLRREPPRRN